MPETSSAPEPVANGHIAARSDRRALRFGLIGASDIAATRVVPALRRRGHERGRGAEPLERSARGRTRSANDIEVGTTELEALLAREDVDAVYISTTNELHHRQAVAAAAAGKHVLCEKPLALSIADAWEIVDAAERAGVVLATNHHLPAAGTHRAIRRLVADGARSGRPLAVRVFHAVSLPDRLQGWRLSSPDRGAGVDAGHHVPRRRGGPRDPGLGSRSRPRR